MGQRGSAELTIADGGVVSALIVELGGPESSVLVTGQGSRLTINGDNQLIPNFVVGSAAFGAGKTAQLTIADGGRVSSSNSFTAIGESSSSDATVMVTGSGSRWDNGSIMYVGGSWFGPSGDGRLVVADNATVNVGESSTVWVAGVISVSSGGVVNFARNLTNEGRIEVSSGGILSAGAITNRGTLIGNGHLNLGEALTNAGDVAPGTSLGTLEIEGDYVQQPAGSLIVEIGGTSAGENDLLAVTGSAILAGAIQVSLADGFRPKSGQEFTVLTAGSVINDGLTLDGTAANMFDLLITSSSIVLRVVPEPTTIILLLATMIGSMPIRRIWRQV